MFDTPDLAIKNNNRTSQFSTLLDIIWFQEHKVGVNFHTLFSTPGQELQ